MIKIVLVLLLATFSLAQEQEKVVTSKLSGSIDLSNYQDLKKREVKIDVDANTSNRNGIYNYSYSPNNTKPTAGKQNILLDGNFDAIYRYKSLYLDGESFKGDSNETFSKILE